MQVLGGVVGRFIRHEAVFPAIECELCAGDPVGHAADGRAKVGVIHRVAPNVAEAEHHVRKFPVAVGRQHPHDAGAEITEVNLKAIRSLERIKAGLAAVGQAAEGPGGWPRSGGDHAGEEQKTDDEVTHKLAEVSGWVAAS